MTATTRRLTAAIITMLIACAMIRAQSVKMPTEVRVEPGRLAAVTIEWDGDDLRWAVPDGLDVFREYDPDPKKVRLRLIGYAPGRYRLVAITTKGGKLSEFATTTVVVGDSVPPPTPPDKPPIPPDKPLPPAGALYFMVVRQDGPAMPAFTKAMADPAWRGLVVKGHTVKDFTVSRARELGINIVVGAQLPVVVTLKRSAESGKYKVAGPTRPMPTTSDAISRLPLGPIIPPE